MLIAGSKTHGLKCCSLQALASCPILSCMLSSNRNTEGVLKPTISIQVDETTEVKNSLTENKHLVTIPVAKNTSFM